MHPNKYNNKQPVKKKSNPIIKLFSILVLLGILVVTGAYFWYESGISSPLGEDEGVVFMNIEEGVNRDQIANKLIKLDILQDSKLFILYTKISGKGSEIKAGNHVIPKNVNIKELVEKLEEVPDETTVWITIPEGLRYDEIAEIISIEFLKTKEGVFSKTEFLDMAENPHNYSYSDEIGSFLDMYLPSGKPIEGFLYPDTYNFNVNATSKEIFETLVRTLKVKIGDSRLSKIENSDYGLYETLNIAAMLEREARTEKQSKMIADIIIRRLEGGYYLGIDATSLYELKDWKAELTYKELKDDNPYNTRINYGLPPTPIANPGIETIDSVVNLTPNEYLYYLHDPNGEIHYGKTNSDHENNIAKYL